MHLPRSLLCLLQIYLSFATAQPFQSYRLSLNSLNDFNTSSLPNPPTFALPTSDSGDVSVSVALCSSISNAPRFFVTNDSTIFDPGPPDIGQPNVYEISLDSDGMGSWTGQILSGGALAVDSNGAQSSFEIGVSNSGPMHAVLDTLPLLGDTTSNQALVFSPAFDQVPLTQPSYPNYTLPAANLTIPDSPSSPPNFTLFIAPSTSSSLTSLPRTGCAMTSAQGVQNVSPKKSLGLWPKDAQGWRWQWLIGGLSPLTNYTAYAVSGTKTSGPIYFTTKSASFACPLVHSLPYCPSTSYAVPLPGPPDPSKGYSADTLPSDVTTPLLSGLSNFTTMLTTLACGRDNYSPLVTCADCQAAYRTWLCAVSLPRCSEQPPSSAQTSGAQVPLPALSFQSPTTPPRNPNLPAISSPYNELLPCLETCNAVDRACPVFLGFKCPAPNYRANVSYGVGFIDSGEDDVMGGGSTGTAQDSFGNVWCNLG